MYIPTYNDPGRGTGDDRDTGHGWGGSYNNLIIVTNDIWTKVECTYRHTKTLDEEPVTIEILDTTGEVDIEGEKERSD